MSLQASDFFGFVGRMDRATFALRGVLLFALKHNIDRFLATLVFDRKWALFNYWIPLDRVVVFERLSRSDQTFLLSMVGLSLPFVWIGVTMTIKRLRDAGLPTFLVVLFFVPVFNLFFFAFLCVIPSKKVDLGHVSQRQDWIQKAVPETPYASAAVAISLTAVCGVITAMFGTTFLKTYGWGLFVCLPFCVGWFSVFIDSIHEKKTLNRCLTVSAASIVLLGILLIALAIEGAICMAMAFPIGLGLGVLGGAVGYTVQAARPSESSRGMTAVLVLFFSPLLMAFETVAPRNPPLQSVRTRIEIAASPEMVWKHVVSFSRLSEPTELLFKAGLAYPIEAKIEGRGVGAVRRCIFSTGEFVEPIRVWDAPRLLAFDVVDMPVPMREMTPYRHVHPAHLDGYFASEKGQFLLTPTRNGTTILEGTTWYRNKMWPGFYWNLWSDLIVHKIHARVLSHIKTESEGNRE